MRRFWMLGLVAGLCLCAMAADAAQPSGVGAETSTVELFVGFSLLHLDTVSAPSLEAAFNRPAETLSIKHNYPGWNAALQLNLTPWLGIVADGSGYYGTPVSPTSGGPTGVPSASFYNALFGPSITVHHGSVKPFFHALFGVNRVGVEASTTLGTPAFTNTAFAMVLGGGLDRRVGRHLGVRLGQVDYLYTQHGTTNFGGVGHQNNFRVSAGLVFTLGTRQ